MNLARRIDEMLITAALICIVVVNIAQAQAAADRTWSCARCDNQAGWEIDINGGPAYVSDDAWRFGNSTGLDEQGGYLFGDVFGRYRDNAARYFTFEGYARGADSSALFLKGGKQSLYELRASYQTIPSRIFDTTTTPFQGSGTGNLTLPSALPLMTNV